MTRLRVVLRPLGGILKGAVSRLGYRAAVTSEIASLSTCQSFRLLRRCHPLTRIRSCTLQVPLLKTGPYRAYLIQYARLHAWATRAK
jgi:hypothetical protein